MVIFWSAHVHQGVHLCAPEPDLLFCRGRNRCVCHHRSFCSLLPMPGVWLRLYRCRALRNRAQCARPAVFVLSCNCFYFLSAYEITLAESMPVVFKGKFAQEIMQNALGITVTVQKTCVMKARNFSDSFKRKGRPGRTCFLGNILRQIPGQVAMLAITLMADDVENDSQVQEHGR